MRIWRKIHLCVFGTIPYVRAIRRSVNDQLTTNPVCLFCRTVDQADPANLGCPVDENQNDKDTEKA